MRIAILAQFPIHILPEFAHLGEPKQHYATWLPQLAKAFSESSKFDFHWVTLTTEVEKPTEVAFLGQKFHLLPTAVAKRASTLFRKDRALIQATLNAIQPQIVHGWGNEDVYGLAAVTSGFPNIVSIQGLLSYYALKNRLPARTYFQMLVELFVVHGADQLVCESLWARDMTRKFLCGKTKPIHHIEYGVQNCFYQLEWTPDPRKKVAIFSGSAEARKGIQDLVDAFSDPRLAEAELWVLGGDTSPFACGLKARSPSNIRWFGRLPIEESLRHLVQGWCFVLPTRADTGPMAVKEAMVVGLPVISSPHSGARDYIREGENGFLVRPGDISALADRLENLLSDFSLCRRMGEKHHREAREQFGASRTAEGLLAIYAKNIA